MKLNNHPFRTAALLLLVMLAAACTKEDDFTASPDEGTANAAPLTITVTDGAYAPTETPDNDNTPDTRAVERGYGTEFTKGDRIGLYVVKQDASENREFLYQNLCLTHDGTGWTLPDGTELTHQPPAGGEILYFAYYPYQDNMEGNVDINDLNPNGQGAEARRFFFRLIERWQPADDQSTYEAYTASDLMVARGEVAKRTDGTDGSVLSFTMKHQMPLAVFRLPTTKYTYSETIDGKPTEKSYRLYSGLDAKAWLADDNTSRRIIKWYMANNIGIEASYYNSSLERRSFSGTIKADSPGKYFLFTVDGGEETVVDRSLREGDFYMRDGGIIPQEKVTDNMPADVKKDCLGVVFWVGEKLFADGQISHWTRTDYVKGDNLLMHDHPGCTHGLVVALKDAAVDKKPWSSSSTVATYTWLKTYSATGQETEKGLMLSSDPQYGYNASRRLQWFRDYGSHPTEAYNAIEAFAKANPTPAGCSGWYFPGDNETTVMARGTLDYTKDLNMTKTLNEQFDKAGGNRFKTDGFYWSSSDIDLFPKNSFYVNFSNNSRTMESKQTNCYVRAVLAF